MATHQRQAPAAPANTTLKNYVGCRKCTNCGRFGHWVAHCRATAMQATNTAARALPPPPQNPSNNNNNRGCYNCGEMGHFSRYCPKRVQQGAQAPRGRAFVIGANAARQDPNVVTVVEYVLEIVGEAKAGAIIKIKEKEIHPTSKREETTNLK
ncbi:hypothetical protein E3N88_34646 [Mikania micrantha]|uniref:CCHC-type domain-containing protein n=1 Tax=Mikania micrantha TaxID=192012 RepID=A0A5N6LZK9_9ASTR|nr:hypothetical protein E3N88_34646 [Mikania micrantha]